VTIALYPGSFDPVTNGHLDIVRRAAPLFEELVIGIYHAPPKQLLFTTQERVDMMRKAVADIPNVRVEAYHGLTVDFARHVGARVIVRGLRMTLDFLREFEMALMNKKLAPEMELVCLMTCVDYQYISSSLIKEVAAARGDVRGLVPDHVAVALREKLGLAIPTRKGV